MDVIFKGAPKQATHVERKAEETVDASISAMGIASGHREKRSITLDNIGSLASTVYNRFHTLGYRRRGLLKTRGPGVVLMWCTTPRRVFSRPKKDGQVRSGNSARSR